MCLVITALAVVLIRRLAGTTQVDTETHTLTVPFEFPTSFPTSTQFSTSCDSVSPPGNTPPPSSTPSPSQTPTPTTTLSLTTSVSSTPIQLPNGSTSWSTQFVTITVYPSSDSQHSTASTPQQPSLNDDGGGGSSGNGAHTAKIVSAVVGGVVGVALLAAVAFWLWKRSRRWDDIFEESDNEGDHNDRPGWKGVGAPVRLRQRTRVGKMPPRVDLDPEPYHVRRGVAIATLDVR